MSSNIVSNAPQSEGDRDGDKDNLDELFNHWMSQRFKAPDLSAMGEAVLEAFGGVKGLAGELRTEYGFNKEGSVGRTYILRSVVDLVKTFAIKNTGGDPLDGVTQDELKAAIRRLNRAA